ncbi:hypothetical protein N7516_010147 [Penicillium verrucosum]|uniref:uncharacterized protein n=1 Tax=Penicillium verrucosum TaxID=60171 RepID=UPI002545335B|nr:uncharacterized protein N7516_010147 [Penicillium verrucosum]KAJ5922444.1 hypothetical protein N7516_010147 [Penicillium verrucosum]
MTTPEKRALRLSDNNNWHDEEDMLDHDKWIDKVEKTLESHNLHNLIKRSIPWPNRRDPNSQKWKTLSKQVRTWMSSSIDSDLMEEINGRETLSPLQMNLWKRFGSI